MTYHRLKITFLLTAFLFISTAVCFAQGARQDILEKEGPSSSLPASVTGIRGITPVVPVDGMKVRSSLTLAPGIYQFNKGIEVAADNITLDCNGAMLIGKDFTATAISAKSRKNITIKNLKAERYYHGIKLEGCENAVIEGCSITRTAEVDYGRNWLDIWVGPEDAYGAGIILINSKNSRITKNDLQHQQNGISLYSCSGITIENNNASYQSGWGIHLNNSSDNIIRDNIADFCNRVHFRRWGDYVGADATGLLMVVNSCRNKVLRNFFRAGGDGVFIAGYRSPELKAPCNNNIFEENDCSLSPNNAFESTFCEGNTFRKNKANDSNYGFWLGYSWKNEVTENEIARNRLAGIAIERGNNNTISRNIIRYNRHGIMLWVSSSAGLVKDFPELADSYRYVINDNQIEANRIGINSTTSHPGASHCRNYVITGNRITDNRIGIRLERTKDCTIEKNEMSGNLVDDVRQIECSGILIKDNSKAVPPDEDPDTTSLPGDVRR